LYAFSPFVVTPQTKMHEPAIHTFNILCFYIYDNLNNLQAKNAYMLFSLEGVDPCDLIIAIVTYWDLSSLRGLKIPFHFYRFLNLYSAFL